MSVHGVVASAATTAVSPTPTFADHPGDAATAEDEAEWLRSILADILSTTRAALSPRTNAPWLRPTFLLQHGPLPLPLFNAVQANVEPPLPDFDVHPLTFRDPTAEVDPSPLWELLRVTRCIGCKAQPHPIDCRRCKRACVNVLTGTLIEWEAMDLPGRRRTRVDTCALVRTRLTRALKRMAVGEKPVKPEQRVRLAHPDETDAVVGRGKLSDAHHLPCAEREIAQSKYRHVVVRRFLLPQEDRGISLRSPLPCVLHLRFPIERRPAIWAIVNCGSAWIRIRDLADDNPVALCNQLWLLNLIECETPPPPTQVTTPECTHTGLGGCMCMSE